MVITTGAAAAASTNANALDNKLLHDIEQSQAALDDLGASLRQRMTELHALQDAFEAAVNKQAKLLRAAQASQTAALQATKPSANPSSNSDRGESVTTDGSAHATEGTQSVQPNGSTEKVVSDLEQLKQRLKDMQQLMPRTGGIFVEMFLGSLNVRFVRKSERIAFKKEYEMLKLKLAPVFVVTCVICLFFEEYRWLHMVLQLMLSCYYVTLAVRENILRVNGSNIRPWWIIHHYFTMMQGVLLLTWPDGVSYALFRRRLHLFGLYNSVLMIFQTRYQMARLYTLRSLGRANEMDVASSDSSQIHWSETMSLILPLIVLGQFMQGYQAVTLFRIYKKFPNELQILLLSLLFTANFIGNSTTTMQVVVAKRKRAAATPHPTYTKQEDTGASQSRREGKKSM